MRTREQLAARQAELKTLMEGIVAANPVTVPAEEQTKFDAAVTELGQIKTEEAELTAAEQRATANRATLSAITPIVTARVQTQDQFVTTSTAGSSASANITVKSEVMTLAEIKARFADCPEQKPVVLTAANGGFRSIGEQLGAIAGASLSDGHAVDPRLHYGTFTPSMVITGAGSSTPTDGGYLIQKDVLTELADKSYGGDEVLSRVRRFGCGTNSDGLTMNLIDETSRVSGSRWGGVQVYYGAEGDSATATKPKMRQTKWELKDVIGLMYATNRLLADAGMLGQVFTEAFASEIRFFVGNGVINDLGGGQILGVLQSNALVSVAKEQGQPAASIVFENINKMWSRMWARSRKNAVWLINQDCEPALDSMAIPVGTGGLPVYLPAGGLSEDRLARLKGAPVIPTEFNPTLGTVGDIMLVDLSQYLLIDKGGPQSDSSVHVRFINNEMTFRFVYRVDGRPLWNTVLTPAKGANTLSPFVALATR
jgi:HK97 family phage major capsid protein